MESAGSSNEAGRPRHWMQFTLRQLLEWFWAGRWENRH